MYRPSYNFTKAVEALTVPMYSLRVADATISEFASPLTNRRTDEYGGHLENRLRLPLEVAELIRKAWDKPLFYRVSASDWLENVEGPEKKGSSSGEKEEWAWWGLEQTTILTQKLADIGIDLIDVSSGGNDLRGQIAVGPSYRMSSIHDLIRVGRVRIHADKSRRGPLRLAHQEARQEHPRRHGGYHHRGTSSRGYTPAWRRRRRPPREAGPSGH